MILCDYFDLVYVLASFKLEKRLSSLVTVIEIVSDILKSIPEI